MQPVPQFTTQEQFIEHYRRLCGHIARSFIGRRKQRLDDASGKASSDLFAEFPNLLSKRADLDAQDLASAALVRLARCPSGKWDQPYYVKRLIVNAIIDELKKLDHVFNHEWCPNTVAHDRSARGEPGPRYEVDFFDTLPGRDGLAQSTQIKYDSSTITSALAVLSQGERLVISFYFGLNGMRPRRERAIAAALGRTQFWVERRLSAGLNRLRKEIGLKPLNPFELVKLEAMRETKSKLPRVPSYPGQFPA
jgi:RNA polymerase sigma factor (sigma-70 family)